MEILVYMIFFFTFIFTACVVIFLLCTNKMFFFIARCNCAIYFASEFQGKNPTTLTSYMRWITLLSLYKKKLNIFFRPHNFFFVFYRWEKKTTWRLLRALLRNYFYHLTNMNVNTSALIRMLKFRKHHVSVYVCSCTYYNGIFHASANAVHTNHYSFGVHVFMTSMSSNVSHTN